MRGRVFRAVSLFFLPLAFLSLPVLFAQTPLDKAIAARFPLTIATADRTDIVTAGSVMTLKKSGLIMFATTASTNANMNYKDGKLSPSVGTRMVAFTFMGKPSTSVVQRTYVQNEKFWLIDIKDASDGVVLQVLSDQVGDNRFTSFIKFPFGKGETPKPEEIIRQISEVMSAEGGGPAETQAAAPAPAPAAPVAPAAPPPPAMAAIPPPPPPTDAPAAEPTSLEKGQSREKVIASLGQPTRTVKMGAKQIDYYKDMKVTYVNGKVTDIE